MTDATMRAIRYHDHGEPADMLRLESAPVPVPAAGHVAVRVEACGLNPADWALCRGQSVRKLPCGIGLDVSGIVTAVGSEVAGVAVGDAVYGPCAFQDHSSAGAADIAVLHYWERLPDGLSHAQAAALPMVVETAARYLDWAGVEAGQTIVINGAGTMVGFAAAQMAILRGARVIATAGETFAAKLRAIGADVTAHGDGMADRLRRLSGSVPDVLLDTAPVNLRPGAASALPALIDVAGGDPKRVVTVADAAGAAETGARTGAENIRSEGGFKLRWNALGAFGRLAGEGRFSIPVASCFSLEEWPDALEIGLAGRARGKLILLPHR